jgi:rhodanese-related sulfurtransferase
MSVLDKLLRRDPDAPPKKTDPLSATEMIRDGAVLVDVREKSEWSLGRAPRARHIPLGQLSDRARELPRNRTILVICRNGNRSARAASHLRATGYTAINVTGGMRAWQASGLDIKGNGGRTGHVA